MIKILKSDEIQLHTYMYNMYIWKISLICLCERQIVHNNLIVIQKSFPLCTEKPEPLRENMLSDFPDLLK